MHRRGPPRPRRHPRDDRRPRRRPRRLCRRLRHRLGRRARQRRPALRGRRRRRGASPRSTGRSQGGSWFHLQRRGYLLVNKARIAALGGRPEIATAAPRRDRGEPDRWPQPAIRALLAETRAALCARRPAGARACSSSPASSGPRPGIDYHAARVRLALARDHLAAGDPTGAATELAAARLTAGRIGAAVWRPTAEALRPVVAQRSAQRSAPGKDARPALPAPSPRHEPRGSNRGLAPRPPQWENDQCSSMSSAAPAPGRRLAELEAAGAKSATDRRRGVPRPHPLDPQLRRPRGRRPHRHLLHLRGRGRRRDPRARPPRRHAGRGVLPGRDHRDHPPRPGRGRPGLILAHTRREK